MDSEERSGDDMLDTDGEAFLTGPSELAAVRTDVVEFIRGTVDAANARGAVVAMSGGIDSTLTAALAAEALGGRHVLGLGLPCNRQDRGHVADARTIAEGLGIEFCEIQLQPLLDMFEDAVAPAIDPRVTRTAVGNVIARLRMTCVYYAANARSRLVVGTANRSELLLGYFTKYGDGGADLYPLGDLYKTEVRALAHHVGIPRRIVQREPTAGMWVGQTDADDLGARYAAIDRVLHRIVAGEDPADVAEAVDIDAATVDRLARRYRGTTHKRVVPPSPGVADRDRDPGPVAGGE